MSKIEELRSYFSNDRFASNALGAVIDEVSDDRARVSVELSDIHKNARGEIMGGVYYTLADFAFAVATNSPEKDTVSTVCQITFLKPVRGKKMTAESRPVKDGRSLCYHIVDLFDEDGTKVAFVSMSGMHLSK